MFDNVVSASSIESFRHRLKILPLESILTLLSLRDLVVILLYITYLVHVLLKILKTGIRNNITTRQINSTNTKNCFKSEWVSDRIFVNIVCQVLVQLSSEFNEIHIDQHLHMQTQFFWWLEMVCGLCLLISTLRVSMFAVPSHFVVLIKFF